MEETNIAINICIEDPNHNTYIYTFNLKTSDTILELRNQIEDTFGTKDYVLFFNNKFIIDTMNQDNFNHRLSYYLIKNGTELKLFRRDINYNNDSMPNPPILKRLINEVKWNRAHIISYYLNKIIIVQRNQKYIFIIVPNGKRYEGMIEETIEDLYNDGYNLDYTATDDEIYNFNFSNKKCFLQKYFT